MLLNKIKKIKDHKFLITVVIGGDGFMLQTLKKKQKIKKFFLWSEFGQLWIFDE